MGRKKSLLGVLPFVILASLTSMTAALAPETGRSPPPRGRPSALPSRTRNKLIVFVGAYFGIFLSHEVIMLVDVPVHKTAQELGVTRNSIYTKYTGLSPP